MGFIPMPPWIPGQENMTPKELNDAHGKWLSKYLDERHRRFGAAYTLPEKKPRKRERDTSHCKGTPPPPPAPCRPTRDSSRKAFPYQPGIIMRLLLRFIDWINGLVGAEKSKAKTNGEQMATLDELFEGYDRERGTPISKGLPARPKPPSAPEPPGWTNSRR